jgi:hypothetical protein
MSPVNDGLAWRLWPDAGGQGGWTAPRLWQKRKVVLG